MNRRHTSKMKSFCLVVVAIVFSTELGWTATISNTVGSSCDSNKQCSKNEYCQEDSFTIPPCASGRCHCLPNYDVQMDCSFDYACTPVVMNLGDKCCKWTSSSVYVNLPTGTHCNDNGTVECRPPFTFNGTVCIASNRIAPGMPCTRHDDCIDGGMVCSVNRTCKCPIDSQIFSAEKGYCVKREHGDPCRSDDDCNPFASTWHQGFTYNSAICSPITRTCGCGNNTEVVVSYLNLKSRSYYNKTICVPSGANINQELGAQCHPDPIYYSVVGPNVKICAPGLVCYRCPEDSVYGKCRKVLSSSKEVAATTVVVQPPTTATNKLIDSETTVGSFSSSTTKVVQASSTSTSTTTTASVVTTIAAATTELKPNIDKTPEAVKSSEAVCVTIAGNSLLSVLTLITTVLLLAVPIIGL